MLKQFLLIFILIITSSNANQDNIDHIKKYLQLLASSEKLDSFADHKRGEIEIIKDVKEIKSVEKFQKQRLMKKGFCQEEANNYSQVGIVYQDDYWIWIRDAVIFPNGKKGTYNRLLWKGEIDNFYGVAVLPVLSDGKIALNLIYRHATRSWEIELPREKIKPDETFRQIAFRELKEEMGLFVKSSKFLGFLAPDAGVLSGTIPVYFGEVKKSVNNEIKRKYSKAINKTVFLTKEELKNAFKQGYLETTINDIKQKIPMRDGFLSFALFQAEIRGYL